MTGLRLTTLSAMLGMALVCSMCAVPSVNAEVPDGGYQFFTNVFRVSHDMVYEDMSFGKYQRQCDIADVQSLIDERGWTTGQVVEALAYLVTNGVPAGTKRWTGPARNKLVYDKSLSMLLVFGGTNALPAIEYVIGRQNPLVSGYAFSEYATVLGFGHDAFNMYETTMFKPSFTNQHVMCMAYGRICNVFNKSPRSNVETNRLVGLLINASSRHCGWMPMWELDERKCYYWLGYATSSNRLEHINLALLNAMPTHSSNYFATARSELLALPPGTMQMLSTNQFYNVED